MYVRVCCLPCHKLHLGKRRKGQAAYAVCNAGKYAGNADTGADFVYSGEVRPCFSFD